jgi:SAM-dependent methyltransferase
MSNEKQIIYWNEVAGPKWVRIGDAMDARLAAINELLLAKAAAKPGETVLDVGSGTGISALPFADAVAPSGHVTGIDISVPMIEIARMRGAGRPNLNYLQADAQTYDFGPQKFDLLASRFGVMFFDDPIAAFTNLRSAMAPGGRLCFICWAPLMDNPHWKIPFDIIAAELGLPELKAVNAPGPLAFSDANYLMDILVKSGFSKIEITPTAVPIIGENLEAEARIAGILGPSGALLEEKEADDETRYRLSRVIAGALQSFVKPKGLLLPATVFVVTAI